MDELLTQALWVLAPIGVLTLLVFAWSLWQAPAVLEREAHLKTKQELAEVRASLAEYIALVQEDNPVRTDPKTGATIIGRRTGPMTIIGGVFRGGVRMGGED